MLDVRHAAGYWSTAVRGKCKNNYTRAVVKG
ncbi:MAG: hypothetical protein JWM28_1693, partial [Chitinophagaceae bacterium]|nr:hypothetical protein [Chitinophagaceae bacterium]